MNSGPDFITVADYLPDFAADALCKEHPELTWFPERGQTVAAVQAIAICRQCLVRDQCRTYAITEHIHVGIWGATTARERRRIARTPGGGTTNGLDQAQRKTPPASDGVYGSGDPGDR